MKPWKLKGGRIIVIFNPPRGDEQILQTAIRMARPEGIAMANFVLNRVEWNTNRFEFVKCRSPHTREEVEKYEPVFAALSKACPRVSYDNDTQKSENYRPLHITIPTEADLMYLRMLG